MLNIKEIQKILPHRYPFLLVDRVIELDEGKKAVAIKNVTFNEIFFQGHFPGNPIMPGVLIMEALAQTAGIAVMYQSGSAENDENNENINIEQNSENDGQKIQGIQKSLRKLGVLTGIDGVRFRRQVVPGDVLKLVAEIKTFKRNICKASVSAFVENQLVASGELMFALVEVGDDYATGI